MDTKNKGRIIGRVWFASSLTYSYYLKTPEGLVYRNDGYPSLEAARAAQNTQAIALQSEGKGSWDIPLTHKPVKTVYTKRGKNSSEDSYLTESIFQGNSRLRLMPEMLPDVPGRVIEKKAQYKP